MPRRYVRRLRDMVTVTVLLGAAAAAAIALDRLDRRTIGGEVRVVDSDTVALAGERVRLRGIDAPELDQSCTGGDGQQYACGRLSAEHLAALVGTGPIACEGHERDRFGRFLAVCSVRGGDSATLNARMVRDGWAVSFGDYGAEERRARGGAQGMWAWSFEQPADWRRQRADTPARADVGVLLRRAKGVFGLGGHNE